MKVLVVNSGSSSVKYQLIDTDTGDVLAKGLCEEIGSDASAHTFTVGKNKTSAKVQMENHLDAIKCVFECLLESDEVPIHNYSDIDAVGHRIVQGGDKFDRSVVINDEVVQKIDDLSSLGPLHNPPAVACIKACRQVMPDITHVAVFDTAFHQTMPPKAYMYPVPYEYYEDFALRRYGAHGTSHRYLALRAAEMLDKPVEDLKIVTCHLGNGASLAAVKGGKCIDTSMGLTPLGGVMMGTRCGDIDPAIVTLISSKTGKTPEEIDSLLNRQSGLLGVSGISNDMRQVEEAAANGNERAQLALDMYAHICHKFLGAFIAELDGADVIVFSAGVGENGPAIREAIMEGFNYIGIKMDKEVNDKTHGVEAVLSASDSAVSVLCIPTNEELMIARDTAELA